jgi:hypothetical protein
MLRRCDDRFFSRGGKKTLCETTSKFVLNSSFYIGSIARIARNSLDRKVPRQTTSLASIKQRRRRELFSSSLSFLFGPIAFETLFLCVWHQAAAAAEETKKEIHSPSAAALPCCCCLLPATIKRAAAAAAAKLMMKTGIATAATNLPC